MKQNTMKNNWNSLKYSVPILLEGFNPLFQNGQIIDPYSQKQLQLNNKSFQENYDFFKNKIINSMAKNYLPIYRMADGEFNFIQSIERKGLSTTEKFHKIIGNCKSLFKTEMMYGREMPRLFSEKLKSVFDPYYFKVAHNESYTKKELKQAKEIFEKCIKNISDKGLLAMHFLDYAQGEHHPYYNSYKAVNEYFDKIGVQLNEYNYSSFYYVYALLTGIDKHLLFKDKNILIITSYSESKKEAINNYLNNQCKVRNVQFIKISPSKSMLEKPNLNGITKCDLVLVGAGIGAVNILSECSKLNTVVIDAGIILERFANPGLKNDRIFLL